MKKNSKTYVLVLGIILVPILFYVVYFLSYNLIDFSLGKEHTRHGYIFFIVLTYPILLLFYWILIFIMDGQCIHFVLKCVCLSRILLGHGIGKGIGVFSISFNNILFWYLGYPRGIVFCWHIFVEVQTNLSKLLNRFKVLT